MKIIKLVLLVAVLFCSTLYAQASGHSVTLSCTESQTTGIAGFNFYRATVSGGPYTQINTGLVATCNYIDTAVSNGVTYFYIAKSFDGTVESTASNEVKAVIPQAPPPPVMNTPVVK